MKRLSQALVFLGGFVLVFMSLDRNWLVFPTLMGTLTVLASIALGEQE